MFQKFLKLIVFILVFVACLLLTNIVSADVFTRFVTSGTFGSQTNEDSLFICDGSTFSTYNTATYDYFTVDNTDLPLFNNIISINYCIQGQGNLKIGLNTEHFSSFIGDGSEQCFHANSVDYHNLGENIYLNNGFGLFGGTVDTDSSTDCLYVKINTLAPTPTNTPTPSPTNTPTPTSTLTPTPTPTTTPTNTPTLIPTATNTPTPESSSTTETTNTVSSWVCSNQKPGSAPVLDLATSSGPNSITLNWEKAKEPVTYYLVTFGTKPGEQLYGNPNVGDSNTTSYTINNLSGGRNYYFKVRAGNSCMPGDYSNEVIGRLIGNVVTGVPEGFTAGVLGASTGPSFQPSPTSTTINIAQDKKEKNKDFVRYIFPVTITILLGGIGWLFKKNT